ncbi:putative cellulosomal scaffoldin protein [Ruminococcus sp. CAG:624]|nr:putative cellulosomal scaffoldin protein [Ruminococcus sp. CAG:624]
MADVDLVDGSITLGKGSPVVTTTAPSTTTPTPTTTKAPTTTATTTKVDPTTPSTGTVLYGDTNCDGKVNIADVVILNKYLTNPEKYPLTAQGAINAEVDLDDKLTTNDSYCIIRSVVKLITLPYKG